MDIKKEQTSQKQEMEKILHTYGLENLLSTNITEDKNLKQFDYGIQEIFNNEPEVVFYYLNDPNMQYIINSNYCENINTFFLNNPTLVLKYCDTQFIKDFVERNPDPINKILKDNPNYINEYKDSEVVQQYQEAQKVIEKAQKLIDQIDLYADNLLELSDNNIFAKQFIEQNQNTIFEKRPDLLLDYNDNEIVKNFVDKLATNPKQYEAIKNRLKQYLTDNPTEVISCQNSAIIKLYSKDLLADQDFKTLLDNELKKTKNNWFFLSQRFENNSFIKDFVKRNPDPINKILTDNPDSLILYSDSKVVKNFTKNLGQGSEQYEAIKNRLKEYFTNNPDHLIASADNPIIKLYSKDLLADKTFMESLHNKLKDNNTKHGYFLSSKYENNSFVKDFVNKNQEYIKQILEANPINLIKYSGSKVVQDFTKNLKQGSEQYKAIKNRLKEYFTNNPDQLIASADDPIIKLCSEDLLADKTFMESFNKLKDDNTKHGYFLSSKYENNSFVKDFVNKNQEYINKILKNNPSYINNYKDSKVVQQYQEAQKLIDQIDLYADNLLELSDNNIFAKQFIEQNQNTIFEKRPDLLLDYNDNEIVKNFVDKLAANPEQYEIIKNGLKEYLKEEPLAIYGNSPILELCSKDLLADQDFKTLLDNLLDNELKKTKNNWFFLSPLYENNSFIKDFVKRNPDPINKILTDNPDYLILYSDSKVVQDFTKNLKNDPKQYEAIKNRLKQYLKEKPELVIKYQNTVIIKDLLEDQDFKTLLHDTLKKPENKHFFLSSDYENNSIIKDFVKRNLKDINKFLTENPNSLIRYSDSKVVQDFVDKLATNPEQYEAIKNRSKQYLTDNPDDVLFNLNTPIIKLYSKDLLADKTFMESLHNKLKEGDIQDEYFLSPEYENNSIIKDLVERNPDHINKFLKDKPCCLIWYSGSKVVQDFTNNLEKSSEQYKAIKNRLKEYLTDNPELVMKYPNTAIIKDLLEEQDFIKSLDDTLKKPENNWFFLSSDYEKNGFVKNFVERNPDPINKILTDNPNYINEYKDSEVVKTFTANSKLLRSQKDHIIMGEQTQKFVSRERKSTTIRSQESLLAKK